MTARALYKFCFKLHCDAQNPADRAVSTDFCRETIFSCWPYSEGIFWVTPELLAGLHSVCSATASNSLVTQVIFWMRVINTRVTREGTLAATSLQTARSFLLQQASFPTNSFQRSTANIRTEATGSRQVASLGGRTSPYTFKAERKSIAMRHSSAQLAKFSRFAIHESTNDVLQFNWISWTVSVPYSRDPVETVIDAGQPRTWTIQYSLTSKLSTAYDDVTQFRHCFQSVRDAFCCHVTKTRMKNTDVSSTKWTKNCGKKA